MAFRLPKLQRSLPIVEENRTPTDVYQLWWQNVITSVESAINGIQDALTAAGIATSAAAAAQAAADSANAAASDAQTAADSANAVSKLSGSGVSSCTIDGTDAGLDATVTISAHTRVYSDNTSVAVNAGSVLGLAYSTFYYIYYDDPTFAGGSVAYAATTSDVTAAQTGGRHLVGSVTTPASGAGPSVGKKILPPGVSDIEV